MLGKGAVRPNLHQPRPAGRHRQAHRPCAKRHEYMSAKNTHKTSTLHTTYTGADPDPQHAQLLPPLCPGITSRGQAQLQSAPTSGGAATTQTGPAATIHNRNRRPERQPAAARKHASQPLGWASAHAPLTQPALLLLPASPQQPMAAQPVRRQAAVGPAPHRRGLHRPRQPTAPPPRHVQRAAIQGCRGRQAPVQSPGWCATVDSRTISVAARAEDAMLPQNGPPHPRPVVHTECLRCHDHKQAL